MIRQQESPKCNIQGATDVSRHRRKLAGNRQFPVEEFFNRDNNETRSVLVVPRGGLTTLNPRPTLTFYIKWLFRF